MTTTYASTGRRPGAADFEAQNRFTTISRKIMCNNMMFSPLRKVYAQMNLQIRFEFYVSTL